MRRADNSTTRVLPALLKQNPPRTILVIITRRIGDVLLATPLIRTLKAAWPQAKLDVLVFENTRDILANHPDVNQIISIPDHASKLATIKWAIGLWHRYDLAVSALPSDRATLCAWLAGKRSIGMLENQPRQRWKKYLLDDWVVFDNVKTHTVSMALALAGRLGLALHYEFNVDWTGHDRQLVDALLVAHSVNQDQPYAVLHIYPKFSYKMWHLAGWLDLVAWLNQQNIQVILTGSSDPSEMRYIQQLLADLPPRTINFAGKLSFAQMAYLLKKAKLYVGPDTVATHLAAAIGTPAIALFGPSNPVKWGPWPKGYHEERSPWKMIGASQKVANVLLLQGLGDCVPCHQEGCDRHINSHSQCLDDLPASRVIAAVKSLLS
jgi:heptosyltransferase-3